MTKKQVCLQAGRIDPHIQLRDVWYVLRQFERKALVHCLNPAQVTGKLYALTELGRKVVATAFHFKVPPEPLDVPWKSYSLVVRAKTRRLLVLELGRLGSQIPGETTASRIRKRLNQTYPIGLNPVMRSLKELVRLGVVQCTGTARIQQRKIYSLTKDGEQIRQLLLSCWANAP